MIPKISVTTKIDDNISLAGICTSIDEIRSIKLSDSEKNYLSKKLEKEGDCSINRYPQFFFLGKIKTDVLPYQQIESARVAGTKLYDVVKASGETTLQLTNFCNVDLLAAFLEGLLLSTYSFDKYKKEKETYLLENLILVDKQISQEKINEIVNTTKATFAARDLVNEPLSYLTAGQFSVEIEKLGNEAGFSLEVFNKKKIEALKMGGLLAVNKGSIDPPTFNILEWKPENAKNKQAIVLVGKGVVYDTGGLSLKPTPNSMDYMKSDMGGAAGVVAAVYAAALNKLPLHIVGLVPATDNRPDGNAYVPGDIITMFDGTTVEIKNTDAEGRLILADALSYAKKYQPQLVIDCATLTGSADIISGPHAAVVMGNSPENMELLKQAGLNTFERLIEVPLWEEYAAPLKSPIADLNNLGTREGQTTIAGKFLEHFTDYNWIHVDMAGTAFRKEKDAYRPAGGTGFGARLLYDFLKSLVN
ncbi:leucyl aminopeptidase family protein [Draconibacterium sp. IB214405]|uniref:leucyl aminopeptidase family protein n=1 Tax=Draconibacterium sp. IB214405 TaxID=3097352 RepID=UPI002A179B0D|nr:leucyl aminopeptidase family protein [Draconibacterium sp. IB214405]MDX8338761.1 leucyl aminopeptidase family protein [Draconibacterium sp. IB214405]